MFFKFKFNLISLIFLCLSFFLFFYTFYKSEILYNGTQNEHYFKYYFLSLVIFLFSSISFFLNSKLRNNLTLLMFSSYFILILIEVLISKNILNEINILKYEIKTSKKFDRRDRYEIFSDLKNLDPNVKITLPPSQLLEYNTNFFPLGGISNSRTINCNENGEYSIFSSDRYGFNNPDFVWDNKKKLITIIGDSYGMGSCVDRPLDIASQLRKRLNLKGDVVNLSYGGNNLLIEYVSLIEYFNEINSKHLIWLVYEDDANNPKEIVTNSILSNYIENESFTQSLPLKQKKIDAYLNQVILEKFANFKNKKKYFKTFETLKLYNLRKLIQNYNSEYKLFDNYSEIIFKKTKAFSEKKGFKITVVYIPSIKTMKTKNYENDNNKSLISLLKKLNINVIDIGKEFSEIPDTEQYIPLILPGHFNEAGYKKISDIIFENIKGKI